MEFKTAFYAIREHLRTSGDHFARIASGAAFEQWLNPEIVACLSASSSLGAGESVEGESLKRDIVVRVGGEVTHVVQVKLLYQWKDTKLLREKLEPLLYQISEPRRADEAMGVRRHGLLVGIWFDNPVSRSPVIEPERSSFHRYSSLVRRKFPPAAFTTQHGYTFERVFKSPRRLRERGVEGTSWQVQVGMLAVTLKRTAADPLPPVRRQGR